jgi:hypothetical protein
MSYFKDFDSLFMANYHMCQCCSGLELEQHNLDNLKDECRGVVVGLNMDIIEELFRMHLTNSGELITPVDLYASIICLQEIGKLPAMQ